MQDLNSCARRGARLKMLRPAPLRVYTTRSHGTGTTCFDITLLKRTKSMGYWHIHSAFSTISNNDNQVHPCLTRQRTPSTVGLSAVVVDLITSNVLSIRVADVQVADHFLLMVSL